MYTYVCVSPVSPRTPGTVLYVRECTSVCEWPISLTYPPYCPRWTDCPHNEWAASPPRCGHPRSDRILYSNLSEMDRILYSSLFAGMMSPGHLPLFIRKGHSACEMLDGLGNQMRNGAGAYGGRRKNQKIALKLFWFSTLNINSKLHLCFFL